MSGANVDDIWASMQAESQEQSLEYRKRTDVTKKKSDNLTMDKLCIFDGPSRESKDSKKKKKKKKESSADIQANQLAQLTGFSKPTALSSEMENGKEDSKTSASHAPSSSAAKKITAEDMLQKIGRYASGSADEDVSVRKQSLKKLKQTLFEDYTLDATDYSTVFGEIYKPLFLRFADPAERCRDLSLQIVERLFARADDVVDVLGYFMPALMKRLPPGIAFDEDMKVFVHNLDEHEAYRRGKAVDRQDRAGTSTGGLTTSVLEESEELRLLMVRSLGTLVRSLVDKNSLGIINPYFHDIIMFLQTHLRDPFADVKVAAAELLAFLAQQAELELGMKFFAVAVVRAALPVLRHRHARVRAAGVLCLHQCMIVKDRAKVKGAGTDAIMDLVGFREENVLPIAAFYKAEVQINYLAELITDGSAIVRERIAHMLYSLLTEIGDRYDHQQRLLPYLLDLLSDECDAVAAAAMRTLVKCGKQYEEEHHDDIIEKRQYGIDGDERINLHGPLPPPFRERPRIGMRLYVRGNTKRFLNALVGELTNWISKTRLKSAQLLKVIVFLCEEHLTMEAHTLFPSYIKALVFARNDADTLLHTTLLDTYEMVGRFTPVEVYLRYVLPRLRGDPDVVPFGVDNGTREAALSFLCALVRGSKPSQLPDYFVEITSTLSDGFILSLESERVRSSALDVLVVVLDGVRGLGGGTGLKHVIESAFLKTGRLNMNDLESALDSVFRTLIEDLQYTDMVPRASKALLLLALVDDVIHPRSSAAALDAGSAGPRPLDTSISPLESLFTRRAPLLLKKLSVDVLDGLRGGDSPDAELALLHRLASSPFDVVATSSDAFTGYSDFLVDAALEASSQSDRHLLTQLAALMVDHLAVEAPVCPAFDGLFACADLLPLSRREVRCRNMQARGAISVDRVLVSFVRNAAFEGSTALKQARVEVLLALTARPDLRTAVSDSHASALLRALVPCIADAANPLALRTASMEGADGMMDVLLHSEGAKPNVSPKVVPFAERGESTATVDMVEVVARLSDVLDDSSDELRRRAVSMLLRCTSLIPQESFAKLLDRLFSRGMNAIDEGDTDFLSALDHLLHALAVLDPALTEEAARRFIPEKGSEQQSCDKTQFLSDMIGHCDLLSSLKRK